MQTVKMSADMVDVARRAADRWYVTVGHAAVGPVNLDLLARGVEAGKVPLDAFVRHEQWKVWRPLAELAVFEDGERVSEPTDDVTDPGRTSIPSDTTASDISNARRDALMILMTAAVARGAADAAIVHEIDEEGTVAVCAHGRSRWEALGVRTPLRDPAVVAVSEGATVVVAPEPDAAGTSILGRLVRLAGPVAGALLIPIRAHDRLVGMLEIGRRNAFRPAEVASLEALVEALSNKLEGRCA